MIGSILKLPSLQSASRRRSPDGLRRWRATGLQHRQHHRLANAGPPGARHPLTRHPHHDPTRSRSSSPRPPRTVPGRLARAAARSAAAATRSPPTGRPCRGSSRREDWRQASPWAGECSASTLRHERRRAHAVHHATSGARGGGLAGARGKWRAAWCALPRRGCEEWRGSAPCRRRGGGRGSGSARGAGAAAHRRRARSSSRRRRSSRPCAARPGRPCRARGPCRRKSISDRAVAGAPEQRPGRRPGASERLRVASVATAATWSASVACRSPSRKPSARIEGERHSRRSAASKVRPAAGRARSRARRRRSASGCRTA